MVEKGSDSSSEKGGVPGTPSTQSLGSRNFIRNSKVGASPGGVGTEVEGRGTQGLVLTLLLSLAEDAELVQCKCWAWGLAGGVGGRGTAVREWMPWSVDLRSHPVLLLVCCVTLSELLNLSGPLLEK